MCLPLDARVQLSTTAADLEFPNLEFAGRYTLYRTQLSSLTDFAACDAPQCARMESENCKWPGPNSMPDFELLMITSSIVSWRQFVRAVEADTRRQRRTAERAAMQRYRELHQGERKAEKLRAAHTKQADKVIAAYDVSQFENYLELLVSVHKDSGNAWDWHVLANTGPPSPPLRANRHEAEASAQMQSYKPGFFDKLLGGDKKQLAVLENAVGRGRDADQAEYGQATRYHQEANALWGARRALAARILVRDVSAYGEALDHAAAFDELASFKTRVTIEAAEPDVIALACEVTDDELIPTENVTLTAAGKLSTKAMAAGRYWALYQDHVCSCALRVAGETFAVLPVSRVIINIGKAQTNTVTGHAELVTFLAVHFVRGTLARLNLDSIDPSDSMKNFPHRMKFKKTSGFESVPPITPDEQWVTT